MPAASALPPALLRRFDVYFKPRAKMSRQPMRNVNAAHIGHIVKLKVGGRQRNVNAMFEVKWMLCTFQPEFLKSVRLCALYVPTCRGNAASGITGIIGIRPLVKTRDC